MENLRPYTFKVKVTYTDGETEIINVKEHGFNKACSEIRRHRKNHEIKSYALISSRSNIPKKEFKQWRKIARKIAAKFRTEKVTQGSLASGISRTVAFLMAEHTSGKYPSIRAYYLRWDKKEYRRLIESCRACDSKRHNFFSRKGLNYDVNLWWDYNPFTPYRIH